MSKIPLTVIGAKSKYEGKEQALQAFIKQHVDVFEEFERLLVDRNEALKHLKSKINDNAAKLGGSFGPYKIRPGNRKFNTDRFIELLGDDAAEPYLKHSIDTKTFDAGVRSGAIPDEVIDEVVSVDGYVVSGPKPVDIGW